MHRAYVILIIGGILLMASFIGVKYRWDMALLIPANYKTHLHTDNLPDEVLTYSAIVGFIGIGLLIWGMTILRMERSSSGSRSGYFFR